MSNEPLSMQWARKYHEWCNLDAAARMQEEMKTTVLNQHMAKLGDIPVAHAERQVKASPEWGDYIKTMVNLRTEANLAKGRLEFLRLKFSEWQSSAADERTRARV